jgi:hypothetical protein
VASAKIVSWRFEIKRRTCRHSLLRRLKTTSSLALQTEGEAAEEAEVVLSSVYLLLFERGVEEAGVAEGEGGRVEQRMVTQVKLRPHNVLQQRRRRRRRVSPGTGGGELPWRAWGLTLLDLS